MKKLAAIFTVILISVASIFASEAEVVIPDASILKNSEGNLEVVINYSKEISGIQLEMSFNPSQIQILEPGLSKSNSDFQVNSRINDGRLIMLVFSMTGKKLIIDEGALLTIPVKPLPGFEGKVDIDITKVILADPSGQSVSLDKKIGEIKVSRNIPKVFKVEPNYPNPFNPETVIKYQIPKSSQVVITVYNLKGQEVRILEESFKEPGFYQTNWNGKNNQGKSVSSGEYILAIRAGKFNHTMKMVFLK